MQRFYGDEPIANRSSCATKDGFVTIEIGDEEPKTYYIHRALLVHHSEYFRKALQGPWIEAKENRVVLKDVDEAVCRLNDLKLESTGTSADLHKVKLFVHWLYVQQFPTKPSLHGLDWDDILNNGCETEWIEGLTIKINAYCFGDRILAPRFRRAMSKAIADDLVHSELYIDQTRDLIDCAFDSVPADRPILQLIVDTFCATWEEKGSDADTLSSFPKKFMMRVMRRYSELCVSWPDDEENEKKVVRCYYEHASVEEKEEKACPHQHMVYNKEKDFGYFE
jgi:hypothetical protein